MICGPEKGRLVVVLEQESNKANCLEGFLGTLTTDTPGQLDVLGHDGDTLGMDGAQVGVFKETDEVSLGSFLQSANGSALKPEKNKMV